MALSPIFKKAYWSLAFAGALYFACLSLLLNGWVQRQALYAHKIHTAWWQNPDKPEQFGFLKNQVQPFNIGTPDEEVLYAWHILPLALYAKHEPYLIAQTTGLSSDITQTFPFKLLSQDPEIRLVISFHGNAGTVAQGWRTDTYRALSQGASSQIHVLTADYRGFGHSTGNPTERGLITDGIALVAWALDVAQIPPERIVIVGQSLGTAVATAVAEHFAVKKGVEFAGLVLVAAFSDIPSLMLTYAIGGFIPVLSALRPYPVLQQFFQRRIQETWYTARRLENYVKSSKRINLQLIHARNDFEIPWSHSNKLFYAAANATSKEGLTIKEMDSVKTRTELGKGGWVNEWNAGGEKRIRQEIVRYGGHNRIVTYGSVAKAVLRTFGL